MKDSKDLHRDSSSERLGDGMAKIYFKENTLSQREICCFLSTLCVTSQG